MRLVKHTMHTKRTKCRDWLRQHGTKLSDERVAVLDAEDRLISAAAYKLGVAIAPVVVPAQDSVGRAIGRTRTVGS